MNSDRHQALPVSESHEASTINLRRIDSTTLRGWRKVNSRLLETTASRAMEMKSHMLLLSHIAQTRFRDNLFNSSVSIILAYGSRCSAAGAYRVSMKFPYCRKFTFRSEGNARSKSGFMRSKGFPYLTRLSRSLPAISFRPRRRAAFNRFQ